MGADVDLISPMLAVPGELPGDGTGWATEFKWDGVRAIAYLDARGRSGQRLRLFSRSAREVTGAYPELQPVEGDPVGGLTVFDGEIVALGDDGRPSFAALQSRMHLADEQRSRRMAAAAPVTFMVFDLLRLDGRSTTGAPYGDRRRLLEDTGVPGSTWTVPPSYPGGGQAVLDAACAGGLEGVVVKRIGSIYQPGRRSPDWVKVKCFRAQAVVIGGWTAGRGSRSTTLGALLLGIPTPSGLSFTGRVGTGFSDDALRDLTDRLGRLGRATSPFDGPVPLKGDERVGWVEPQLVGEVRFGEWTRDGRLRHPTWRGLRPDVAPGEVVRES
jgi:bifunctional non-homologous end joining protein LigD